MIAAALTFYVDKVTVTLHWTAIVTVAILAAAAALHFVFRKGRR
jgi:hypothetical protein